MALRKRQIHDVEDDDYQKFTALARLNGMTIAEYLGILVRREWEAMVVREGEAKDAVESKS